MKVIFRRVLKEPLKGDIVAVFPCERADADGNMLSYMRIGQHSACTPEFIVEDTAPSSTSRDRHGDMKEHLENDVGYTELEVVENIEEATKLIGSCFKNKKEYENE